MSKNFISGPDGVAGMGGALGTTRLKQEKETLERALKSKREEGETQARREETIKEQTKMVYCTKFSNCEFNR